MDKEQIVKALECCGNRSDCTGCYYDENQICGCLDLLMKEALALINSQEQRIKELAEENERLTSSIKILVNNNADLEFELAQTYDLLEESKADTVRKMQERLKEAPIKVGLPLFGLQTKDEIEDYANGLILQMRDAIDQIAKEMLEGENER